MSDDNTPRSEAARPMLREKQAITLKAARERGLWGKAFDEFARSIGVSRTDAFEMVRDHSDRGFGARESPT